MGFARRKRRKAKGVLLILGIAIALAIVTGSTYLLIESRTNLIESSYAGRLENLQLEAYLNQKVIYMPLATIQSGTILTEDLLVKTNIVSNLDDAIYFTSEEIGQYNIVDLEPGIPILKYVVAGEFIAQDIRVQEFYSFQLPTVLSENQFIDVRLSLPNGEDYIILSKKKVQNLDLENNIIWLWLSEMETLEMSSAIVDAYLKEDSIIYTTIYVDPELQEAAIPTYPVNTHVLVLMQDDPNILAEAKASLSSCTREALEERLNGINPDLAQFQAQPLDEIIQTDEITEIIDESSDTIPSNTNEDTSEEVISSDSFFD